MISRYLTEEINQLVLNATNVEHLDVNMTLNIVNSIVAGRVIDGATGKPINNAGVSIIEKNLSSLTVGAGFFRIIDVPPGNLTMQFEAHGWVSY